MFKKIVIFIIILNLSKICLSEEFKRIAFFPLENISGSSEIPEGIPNRIAEGLHKKYDFEVILPADLKSFLFRNRIRRLGSVTEAQVKGLKREFKADAVVITWLDLYEKGNNPKIGVGIRVVETETAMVVWGDYTSFTGEDFTGWLGLGKINSVDDLMSKALKKLVDNFPPFFKKDPTEKALFALERFSLFPLAVHGGAMVHTSVHIVSLREPPEKVFLLLGGKKWPFKRKQNGWWEGEIQSPQEEGHYFARIKIVTKNRSIYFLDTASYLTVDNTPPKLRLSYENPIFSPNRDGRKDALIVFPKLLNPENIGLWSFYVYNKKGEIVRKFEGSGDLPLGLAWHGETDEFSPVKDDIYYIECKCQDKAGNIGITSRKKITLDKTPPKLEVVIDLKENKAKFNIDYKDLLPINQWELSITDKDENIYYNLRKENGEIPSKIEIPLPKKKELFFLIEAFDMAGNKTEYKTSLISKKVVAGEKPKEKKKAPTVWDYNF